MSTTKSSGRFKPGQSGNPAGRKPGQRHRSTVMLEKLLAADAKTIVKAVLLAAATGDMSAARMVLDRVVPAAKDRAVSMVLPDTSTPDGIEAAACAVLAACARGDLLLSEGVVLSQLIEGRRKAAETVRLDQLAELVAALEKKVESK